jgi:hypothetical protein
MEASRDDSNLTVGDTRAFTQANASVKDFGIILTTVSNIVFDLVLVMLLTDDRK